VIGENDRNFVEGATYSLSVDEELQIGKSKVRTLHVPCHTKGHTIYSFLPKESEEEH
jgi:glyoxylase-like metal-dependent hydrolase (beta-lactamase superfamily II)